MSEYIKIEDLTISYDDTIILKDINLNIHKGEFLCILGASGCGKTTLLNALGGFIKKDAGKMTIKGKDVTKPVKQCIMVFQEFDQLFPWMTLKKNIEFVLKNSHIKYSKNELDSISSEYIQMVKLQEYKNYYPHQLSGGMKQRTAIARAVVTRPEVLLMDEPFGSLDIQTKNELHENLLNIWKETQTTIIFVTHDVREALKLADRIVIIKNAGIKEVIINKKDQVIDDKVEEITAIL